MVPHERPAPLLARPPPPPPAPRARRPKNTTLEAILAHAREYMRDVAETDPRGAELQRAAFARHTLRLKALHSVAPDEELTVQPEALVALTQRTVGRPWIVRQPQDAVSRQGVAGERIKLEVEVKVLACVLLHSCALALTPCAEVSRRWRQQCHRMPQRLLLRCRGITSSTSGTRTGSR
jgi:hypothetical protein